MARYFKTRLEIRKIIQEKGKKMLNEIVDMDLQFLVGEIMALNEEYVLNHQHGHETIGSETILKTGFTDSQFRRIYNLNEKVNELLIWELNR